MPVEIVDHTADIRLRARGRSLTVTLLELANFMLSIIFKGDIDCEIYINSSVSYIDKENCVVRLLSDILFYTDTQNLALKVRFIQIVGNNIIWEGCGEKFKRYKHEMGYVVKGVTYDRLVINTENNLIEITLDI